MFYRDIFPPAFSSFRHTGIIAVKFNNQPAVDSCGNMIMITYTDLETFFFVCTHKNAAINTQIGQQFKIAVSSVRY
ncbi:hypothetical protein A8C56_06100 [Niabella ginsenosidivorans]|uniref:Uncharacterized protein n=1 Tax=Niabella ginsenosidivorans TaxID=1176587 RepID=A0A1A9I1M9_9BACT|nr:hypothetical protein A8C56_06100 [Niabella ginsenosidivorans]